jgi:hypothetical protein
MVRIRKLKTVTDIIMFTDIFNKAIGYSNVPWQYHASGKCYAMFRDGKMEAGFCLIDGYWNLRAIRQIPYGIARKFEQTQTDIAYNMCDLTAYFISTQNLTRGILFTLYLVWTCLNHSTRYFAYTYPIHDRALEKYYGRGNPIRIHTGVPVKLEGHGEHMEAEHVEVLSTWGIVKIFYHRTKRMIHAHRVIAKKIKVDKIRN